MVKPEGKYNRWNRREKWPTILHPFRCDSRILLRLGFAQNPASQRVWSYNYRDPLIYNSTPSGRKPEFTDRVLNKKIEGGGKIGKKL